MSAILEYFKKIVDFKSEELEHLKNNLKEQVIEKDDYFIKEGQVCKKIGFIVSGIFEMTYMDKMMDEHILEFIFQNNFVTDYSSFITQSPTEFNIKAIKKCELLYFDKTTVTELYEQSFNFQKFGRLIAEAYFIRFAERIKENSLSPKVRYEKMLKENGELVQSIPQYKIASYWGISAEWLSKLRAKK